MGGIRMKKIGIVLLVLFIFLSFPARAEGKEKTEDFLKILGYE